jgi:uncharacterized RDD family membrane protein YckC
MNYTIRHEFHTGNEFMLATIRKRFVAFLLDWIVLILIYFAIVIVFTLFDRSISNINVHGIFEVELEIDNTPTSVITFVKLLLGLLPVIYFTLSFYFWKGQTVGKFFLGIRVLSLYHERIGLWHCTERSLGYFASALEGGFGYIQAFWNPNRMALHDKIGETIVIQRRVKKRK